MGDHIDDDHDRGYPATLGARLRSLRRQQHLSLQDVEAASDHEFKVSVLGAYERGERAISGRGSSAWPASTGCRSTAWCPETNRGWPRPPVPDRLPISRAATTAP